MTSDLSARKITICFRCDDFFALKDNPMENFYNTKQAIIETFKKHDVPLTIGVIPFIHASDSRNYVSDTRLTPEDPVSLLLKTVMDDKNFEIAQHGFTHNQNRKSGRSEFLGLSLEMQGRMIEEGKQILDMSMGTHDLATFIPPWNSFDLNTVKAARKNGFTYLSGDVGIVKNRPFKFRTSADKAYDGIKLIPGTCSLKELQDVLRLAKKDPGDSIIVVIFHPYELKEYHEGTPGGKYILSLSDLDRLLKTLKQDVELKFIRIRDINPILADASRYTAACRYSLVLKAFKPIIPRKLLDHLGFTDSSIGFWMDKGRYLSLASYRKMFIEILSLLGSLSLAVTLLLGGLIRFFIEPGISKGSVILPVAIFVLSLSFFVCFCFLEYRFEILTAPTMSGLLFLSLFSFLLLIITFIAIV